MRWTLVVLAAFGVVLVGCTTIVTGHGVGQRPLARVVASSAPSARTSPAPQRPASTPPSPCAGNTAPKLVRVSVAQQHEWMCAGAALAYETPVTTGIPTDDYHTPTGTYVVQAKQTQQTLTLLTGDRYVVDYWIPFDAPLFGFHDSAWQAFPYGSARYRTDGSHGCVHMPLAAIAWLYRWVVVGTPVVIS